MPPTPCSSPTLEAKILRANDAVSQLLGFRPDEVIEQSLSWFISLQETSEFTVARAGGGEGGDATPGSTRARRRVIPTTLNASALASDGRHRRVGILRDIANWTARGLTPRA
jgi:PAS domain S-box-containing protein